MSITELRKDTANFVRLLNKRGSIYVTRQNKVFFEALSPDEYIRRKVVRHI